MKNGGGHFAPKLGGQFELESGGHFKLELGGQYHWNLQRNQLSLPHVLRQKIDLLSECLFPTGTPTHQITDMDSKDRKWITKSKVRGTV